jgi:pyruvate formate lyase activating enzyme
MIKAAWWHSLADDKVLCDLCPVACTLKSGQKGPCGTRVNENGEMLPLHYGELVAAGMDPIEKKPLYHFHPGLSILSVAAPGCNLHCRFCQNSTISQGQRHRTSTSSPKQVVKAALAQNSMGIAYTYSEPLVWFEFVRDTAREARAAGLKNVLVTNGFLNPEPLAEILPFIDAANIDLKAMDDDFYRNICKAGLEPVLAAIRQFHEAGVHIELTNLLIPGHNDSDEQISRVVDFVADLDSQIPLHFSAYHPAWKMVAPPTPRGTMLRALELAKAKLPWVYLGNIVAEEGRDTLCPDCGEVAINRASSAAGININENGRCLSCDRLLPIIMT